MFTDKIIIDADFCIKAGASEKYRYLEKLLPLIANKVYIHEVAYDEIIIPSCAKAQLDTLISQGVAEVVSESTLGDMEKTVYQGAYQLLAKVMLNPNQPRKNHGEVCSLAMAKTKSIPYFATDEANLQPIIDRLLNNGIDDIKCIRIEDVVRMFKKGELKGFTRKEAKILWRLSGKDPGVFDRIIWQVS